jgi:hypothetical protein
MDSDYVTDNVASISPNSPGGKLWLHDQTGPATLHFRPWSGKQELGIGDFTEFTIEYIQHQPGMDTAQAILGTEGSGNQDASFQAPRIDAIPEPSLTALALAGAATLAAVTRIGYNMLHRNRAADYRPD